MTLYRRSTLAKLTSAQGRHREAHMTKTRLRLYEYVIGKYLDAAGTRHERTWAIAFKATKTLVRRHYTRRTETEQPTYDFQANHYATVNEDGTHTIIATSPHAQNES